MKFCSGTFLATSLTAASIGCGASAPPTASAPRVTGDPFVGDWNLDPSRCRVTDLMKVESVNGDTYAFNLGGGTAETIATDGTDQPGLSGTTLAVTAEGPDHWKVVRKKDGRVLLTAMWTLSHAGNTLHDDYTEFAPNGDVSLHGSYVYERTADGRGFEGAWEGVIPVSTSLSSFQLQIRPYAADGLSLIRPSLELTVNLGFDGKDYPMVGQGAAEGATASARRVDERTLEVTDKINGKISKTERIEVSPDLQTLTQTIHPAGQRGPRIFVFERATRRAG